MDVLSCRPGFKKIASLDIIADFYPQHLWVFLSKDRLEGQPESFQQFFTRTSACVSTFQIVDSNSATPDTRLLAQSSHASYLCVAAPDRVPSRSEPECTEIQHY